MTNEVQVSRFSHIQVSDVFDVNVSIGEPEKVTLRVDDNLVDRLDVRVVDQTLHLRLESGTSVRHATLHADVFVPSLSGIELSGASKVHLLREFAIDVLEVSLSGASEIDGSLQCGSGSVTLSGASTARFSGSVGILVLEASGASDMDAERLEVDKLTVALSGSSSATISVTGTISAEVSGASSLRYRGHPRFTKKDISGASSIEPL